LKTAQAALAAIIVAGLAFATEAAPDRTRPNGQAAAPQSRDETYRKCLAEAFRKFGWYYGARRVLYSDFAVSQTDYCVRNGGHF
jgi:hypothetical protein